MPRDEVSRTANVERNGGHKWVNSRTYYATLHLALMRRKQRYEVGHMTAELNVLCGQRNAILNQAGHG